VGTNTIAIRTNCNGSGCDISGVSTYTWTVVADPTVSDEPIGISMCSGDSYAMSTTISGGTGLGYQWEYSTDETNWFSVGTNLPAVGFSYSGSTTATLSINTTSGTPASIDYYFRCVITSGSGCNPNPLYTTSAAVVITIATINPGSKTWVGAAMDNDWDNPVNWDCGGIPNTTSLVIIPPNSTPAGYFPIILSTQTALCKKITIEGPPSMVQIQPGGELQVHSP
jgi:hypothetical protein